MPFVTDPTSKGAFGFIPAISMTGVVGTRLYPVESTCVSIRHGDVMKFSTGGIATRSSSITQPIGDVIGFAAQSQSSSNFDSLTPTLLIYDDPNALYMCAMTSSEILLSSGIGALYAWTNTTGGMSTGGGGTPTYLYSQMTIQSTPLASTGATKGYLQAVSLHPVTAAARAAAATGVSSSAAGATGYMLVRFFPAGSPAVITS